jgi:hypothetical protein
MLRNGWVSFALYFAVSGVSVAEEKKADPYARIDLHPDCVKDPVNLVVNCGFETGDFDGWDLSGDFSNTFVTETAHHSGNFGVLAASPTLAFIAQTLSTTSGQTYTVSIWFMSLGQPNEFQLFWDGNLISDLMNIGNMAYTQMTWYGLTASSAMTQVKFGFSNLTGFFYVDDVQVEAF